MTAIHATVTDVLPIADLPALEDVELEPITSCPLCGTEEAHTFLATRHWTAWIEVERSIESVICARCGLLRLNSTLPFDVLERPSKHGGGYTYGKAMTIEECDKGFHRQHKRAQAMLGVIGDNLDALRARRGGATLRAIDVLSEAGGVVAALNAVNIEAAGLDSSIGFGTYAREHKGLTIHDDHLYDHTPETRYDLITALRVVNHYRDPMACLNALRRLVSDDGLIYFELIDFAHALARKPLPSCLHVDHPTMFTSWTARAALTTAGFEILLWHSDRFGPHELGPVGSANHLHILCRPAAPTEVSPPADAATRARLELLTAVAQYDREPLP